ncbi:DUF3566 domain-containing protein [Microlunatus antarcticus]
MSEGTPGRGPDADSRTDTDGQAPTNGRPAVPPVRYGPRNGNPAGANGRGGSNGRPQSAPSSPQQYRAPQPPRTPNGTPPNGTPSNGAPSNGTLPNGSEQTAPAKPVTPSSYTRPRTNGTPTRPEPSEQERRVAEARVAAAARNASAAKVRGGSALSGRPAPAGSKLGSADAGAPVDETAVIPAVQDDKTPADAPAEVTDAPSTTETPAADPGRGRFGRLRTRDRRPAATTVAAATAGAAATAVETSPAQADQPTPEAKADAKTDVKTDAKTDATTDEKATETATEPGSTTEADATTAAEGAAPTAERPLTWRDRLGLPPKTPKTPPAEAPATDGTTVASGDTDATVTTAAALGTAGATEATVSAFAPTAPVQDRVSPSPFAPGGNPDTVVIPAVDVAATGAPTPTAGATALPVVPAAAPKPKVGAARRTRKARLRLSRVDPWSVMKTALLFSIAAGIILVVATYGVWSVLNASGLFDAVNDMVKSVVSTPGDTTPFRIEEYVNTQKIIGVAALIAVVDVLIFTALATLGSFLYNLAATVLGGLEVTLAED